MISRITRQRSTGQVLLESMDAIRVFKQTVTAFRKLKSVVWGFLLCPTAGWGTAVAILYANTRQKSIAKKWQIFLLFPKLLYRVVSGFWRCPTQHPSRIEARYGPEYTADTCVERCQLKRIVAALVTWLVTLSSQMQRLTRCTNRDLQL